MTIPATRFDSLKLLLEGNEVPSKRVTYHCCHIDKLAMVFSESEGIRKVMIPTDVVMEWISAYEYGIVNLGMTAREMRDEITEASEWAPIQHNCETHLMAIVQAWASNK